MCKHASVNKNVTQQKNYDGVQMCEYTVTHSTPQHRCYLSHTYTHKCLWDAIGMQELMETMFVTHCV